MGTQYLKGSTAIVNYPEQHVESKYNGMELTLTLDTCGECIYFPMAYINPPVDPTIENFDRDHLKWINVIQRDYG